MRRVTRRRAVFSQANSHQAPTLSVSLAPLSRESDSARLFRIQPREASKRESRPVGGFRRSGRGSWKTGPERKRDADFAL
jgi:hypothetical protein